MVSCRPVVVLRLWWSGSGQGLHVEPGQLEVVVDAECVDGPQVGDPVSECQQVRVVDGHLILTVGAADLQLQQQNHKLSDGPLTTLHGAFMDPLTPERQTKKDLHLNGC